MRGCKYDILYTDYIVYIYKIDINIFYIYKLDNA